MASAFKGKRILIFGLGLNQGGVGSAKFFAKQGAQVKVTDLKNAGILKPSLDQLKKIPDISYTLGQHKYEDILWADLIIKNPAVKPGNPFMEYARKHGKKIEMDMGIFLQFIKPSQIIGITGTKGKSTTASLIYEVLSKHLGGVKLAGNIGKSVLDTIPHIIPDTLVVLEISSFQLEAFNKHKVSPKWAVITNITPDHLNYYTTMDEYVDSKKIIGKYQTGSDYLFLRKNDPATTNPDFLKALKGKIIYFSKDDLLASPSRLASEAKRAGGPKDFKPNLIGEHNLENMAAALAVVKTFGVDETTALEVLSSFKGIPFRMELTKKWNGVKIYNDTTATSPEAGIQAIQTFPGSILICGGMNKGLDYKRYANEVAKNVKKVYLLEGDSTTAIISSLRPRTRSGGSKLDIHGPYHNLEKLLANVKTAVKPGDIVLFSPAATSFNLFQNEFDRGRQFNQAVQKVFK